MNRRHDVAAQVAKNTGHTQRLGLLYRNAPQPNPGAAELREQLRQAANALALHRLDSAADVEQFARSLQGLTRVAGALRAAIDRQGGSHAT